MRSGAPSEQPACTAPTVNRRLLTAVFAASNTVAFVAMAQMVAVVLDPMAVDLGVSRTAVAFASTISTLVGAVAAVPIGRLLDRHGGRVLMTAGSAVGALAVVMWSQATSLPLVYAAFVLVGLSLAASTYEATFAVIVVATDAGHRDRTILLVTMIAGLTTYLVYPLLGRLESEFGWRTALLILAGLMALIAVPGHLWAIPSRATHRRRVQMRSGVPVGAALRQARFWLIMIAFVTQAASAAAFLLLVVAYLLDAGLSHAAATSVPITVGVLQILSRLVLTSFARWLPIVPATCFCFAVQGVGLLCLPLCGLSIPLTVACVAAIGLGQGVAVIARPMIVASSFGVVHFASVMAAIAAPTALARAGYPLVATWLGDWRFLVIGGVVSLVGALALLPLVGARGHSDGSADPHDSDAQVRLEAAPGHRGSGDAAMAPG